MIRRGEAERLLQAGFAKGLVSVCDPQAMPKYVWALDDDGEAYEAKLGRNSYHGYRLKDDERDMRDWIADEWGRR